MTRQLHPTLKESLALTPEQHLAVALERRQRRWGKRYYGQSWRFFWPKRKIDAILSHLGSDAQADFLFFTHFPRTYE